MLFFSVYVMSWRHVTVYMRFSFPFPPFISLFFKFKPFLQQKDRSTQSRCIYLISLLDIVNGPRNTVIFCG